MHSFPSSSAMSVQALFVSFAVVAMLCVPTHASSDTATTHIPSHDSPFAPLSAPPRICRICDGEDCCSTPYHPMFYTCKSANTSIVYTILSPPGRPLWLSAQMPDGRSVGSSLIQTGALSWMQWFAAHAFFIFNDDLIYISDDKPALCTRRWGCLSCFPSSSFSLCTNSWVNITVFANDEEHCAGHTQGVLNWWGEDVGHGLGFIRTCFSRLPNQLQPQPPLPANNATDGTSWILQLGGATDGVWPESKWSVACQ